MKTLSECIKEEHKLRDEHNTFVCGVFSLAAEITSIETAAYVFICQAIFRLHSEGRSAKETRDFIVECVNINMQNHSWKE